MKCKICEKELYCCEYLDNDKKWVIVTVDATSRKDLWEDASRKLQIPVKFTDDGTRAVGMGSLTSFIKISIPKDYIDKKIEFKKAANYYVF